MLGSAGRSVPSLYQLYVGGGDALPSKQDRRAAVPVVTVAGTLQTGGDGGTVGHNGFQTVYQCTVEHSIHYSTESIYIKNILTQNSHLHTDFSILLVARHFTVIPSSIMAGHFGESQI